MKLEDINKIYTKYRYEYEEKLDKYGEKYFLKKVLPRIKKAAAQGQDSIEFVIWSQFKYDMLKRYVLKNIPGLSWDFSTGSNPPFSYCIMYLRGWKLIEPEPNDLLKKNL